MSNLKNANRKHQIILNNLSIKLHTQNSKKNSLQKLTGSQLPMSQATHYSQNPTKVSYCRTIFDSKNVIESIRIAHALMIEFSSFMKMWMQLNMNTCHMRKSFKKSKQVEYNSTQSNIKSFKSFKLINRAAQFWRTLFSAATWLAAQEISGTFLGTLKFFPMPHLNVLQPVFCFCSVLSFFTVHWYGYSARPFLTNKKHPFFGRRNLIKFC